MSPIMLLREPVLQISRLRQHSRPLLWRDWRRNGKKRMQPMKGRRERKRRNIEKPSRLSRRKVISSLARTTTKAQRQHSRTQEARTRIDRWSGELIQDLAWHLRRLMLINPQQLQMQTSSNRTRCRNRNHVLLGLSLIHI